MVSEGSAGIEYLNNAISFSTEPIVFEDAKTSITYNLKEQRKTIREWAKINLVGKELFLPKTGMNVTFTLNGIKEAINQPHKFILKKNEFIKEIETALQNAEYIKSETDRTGELNFIFHYFRTSLNEEDSFIVLKEIRKEGKIVFYSIVDKIKNDPGPR
jgi:hypothetical protein